MNILFDLDQTLVDSVALLPYREKRQWRTVMALIPSMTTFAGVPEMLDCLLRAGHCLGVVTSAPRMYCEAVIRHLGLAKYFTTIVCYHDTRHHKPHPEPVLFTLQQLGADPAQSVMIGDEDRDIAAGRAAGVTTVLASWGITSSVTVQPVVVCQTPRELVQFIVLTSAHPTMN